MSCKKVKTYVAVTASYDTDGTIHPLTIHWRDGHIYEIDRILDVRPAASLKVGGCGTRFSCRIQNTTTHLFLEEGRWFVEEKVLYPPERKDPIV